MQVDYRKINQTRERALRAAESRRISDESAMATRLQQETGCSRTEALQAAYNAMKGVSHA